MNDEKKDQASTRFIFFIFGLIIVASIGSVAWYMFISLKG